MSCQVRDGLLDTFISHESQNFPPSLSTYGDIRTGTKLDIVQCLEKMSSSQNAVKIFHEYSQQVFLPFLNSQLDIVSRVDIVWYVYFPMTITMTMTMTMNFIHGLK